MKNEVEIIVRKNGKEAKSRIDLESLQKIRSLSWRRNIKLYTNEHV